MGLYSTVNDLKIVAINTWTCNMASFGDISEYDNKTTIAYPYVNIDVVTGAVTNNGAKEYTFRIYVCDRNEPYIAYNKAELILDTMMHTLDIPNYTINYFTLDFKDVVNGIYADIQLQSKIDLSCFVDDDSTGYVILENGDVVAKNYVLTEVGGHVKTD